MGKSRSINNIPLIEIFESIQGEGRNAGEPSVFIRTAGCTLKCKWCDSKYAWDINKAERIDKGELSERLAWFESTHLVITGGEPLLYQKFYQDFIESYEEYDIEFETNGTIAPQIKNVQYSVSPKLTSSGNTDPIKMDILKKFLDYDSIFKFVIKDRKDWIEANFIIREVGIPNYLVYIMPEGVKDRHIKKKAKWLLPLIIERSFNLSPRLQVWLAGKKRGV